MKNQKKIENFGTKILTTKEMATLRGGDGVFPMIKPTPPSHS
jgi:hypothetical protein